MNIIADKCNRCGKVVVKHSHSESSDMVQTNDSFLYLCDIPKGESSRPSLQLKEYCEHGERLYCLDCLLETIKEWVEKMKKRAPSKIPLNNIIFGNKGVTSPCPVCGK